MEFRDVRLTGAVLSGSRIGDARFVDCRPDLAALRFTELERVRFERCRMPDADLYGAKLWSVVLASCDLVGSSLAEASFDRCEMRGCDLDGVGDPQRLRGVGMPWPDVVRAAATLAAAAGIHVVEDEEDA